MKQSQQAEAPVWCQVVCVLIICILPAAQQCGVQAGGVTCPGGLCCSQYAYCGTSIEYCGEGCQSNCRIGCGGLICILNETMYDKLWPNRDAIYTFPNFYQAYQGFVPLIGREGTQEQKLREVAALSAHIQQETAGLFYVREIKQSNSYCDNTNKQYPCARGQKYFGRGPLQLTWNYNYGPARDSGIGADILEKPDLVAQNGTLAWRAALWFWNRTDNSIPSIHDVMVGKWTPSHADLNAGRKPGFGMTINIINGGIECGSANPNAANRIQYYKQFCKTLGVDPGSRLRLDDTIFPLGSSRFCGLRTKFLIMQSGALQELHLRCSLTDKNILALCDLTKWYSVVRRLFVTFSV